MFPQEHLSYISVCTVPIRHVNCEGCSPCRNIGNLWRIIKTARKWALEVDRFETERRRANWFKVHLEGALIGMAHIRVRLTSDTRWRTPGPSTRRRTPRSG